MSIKKTMCQRTWITIIHLYFCFLICDGNLFSGCEIIIRSGEDNATGTVTTPGFEDGAYAPNTQCLFKFIGRPRERVKIDFLKFMVRGVMPECINDYVDIWIEVPSEETPLIESPLFGRYCGVDHLAGPKTTVSLTNIYVLAFLSDDEYESKGLKIQYEFLDGAVYRMGRPAPPNVCGWTIERRGKRDKKGTILTPSYPGLYPSNLFCFYKFKGRSGDRIRVDFEEFDLYGDNEVIRKPKHCPYDYVRIYDGFTNEAPTIGTYCWKSQPFSVFSSGHHLLIEFVSKVGHDMINFGFKASYLISNKLVKLNFIEKSPVTQHILGTECDQRIMSGGESRGMIVSPNYPSNYPLELTCQYFIDGMDNREDLEVALLRFQDLNIPTSDSKCSNGSVSVFVKEKSHTQQLAPNEISQISQVLDPSLTDGDPDYTFCGPRKPADVIFGAAPRTLLVFDSHGAKKAKGFKAKYEFIKRYGVSGTATPDSSCVFRYNSGPSGQQANGTFNSPRNPGLYPDNLECVYHFLKTPGERIFLAFTSFQIETNEEKRKKAGRCIDDTLEVRNVYQGGAESVVGLFCAGMTPGPAASDARATQLKLIFRSNGVKDDDGDGSSTGTGFTGSYSFIPSQQPSQECGAEHYNQYGGALIMRAYKPGAYCLWRLKTSRGRILLTFNSYAIEGGGASGCQKAVLRVYKDASPSPNSFPEQICGADGKVQELISDGSTMNVEFVSFLDAEGKKGFVIGWAESYVGGGCPRNTHYECRISGRCIPRRLVCDKVAHCGASDLGVDVSDETENCPHEWPLVEPVGSVSLSATEGNAAPGNRASRNLFILLSVIVTIKFL